MELSFPTRTLAIMDDSGPRLPALELSGGLRLYDRGFGNRYDLDVGLACFELDNTMCKIFKQVSYHLTGDKTIERVKSNWYFWLLESTQ